MSGRDLAWKAGGCGLTGLSTALCMVIETPAAALLLFPLALLGLPLMIHGKRVAQAFRAEYRGHRHTGGVVHAARVRRRGHEAEDAGR